MTDAELDDLWSVLEKLANESETELRRILRPHEEAGLIWKRDEKTILRRIDLDRALGALTLIEIVLQIGEAAGGDGSGPTATPIDPASIPADALTRLFQSEALLHYCDSYLYFGVRFLAQRYYPAKDAATKKLKEDSPADPNWRAFALHTPPLVYADPAAIEIFRRLHGEPLTDDEKAAQCFLDGYLDNPLDYELWLRGLLAQTDDDQVTRFNSITQGIKTWVEKRVEFYLQMSHEDAEELLEDTESDGFASAEQSGLNPCGSNLNPAFSAKSVLLKSALGQEDFTGLGRRRRPVGGWYMNDPLAARFGLADFYWIARLLRANVSSAGVVNYSGTSWMHLLRFHANRDNDNNAANTIFQYEEVLRSVFDFCCDLIQNAITVTRDEIHLLVEPDALAGRPKETERWQHVFDEELREITGQRALRSYAADAQASGTCSMQEGEEGKPGSTTLWQRLRKASQIAVLRVRGAVAALTEGLQRLGRPRDQLSSEGWSERLTTGETPRNLVGIALSGGGIRSATFNLGVLQGLQEFDLLRQVDYISTVSGGGFIGSWLVANVRRSAHWLGRVTDWSASISHLRAYSDYLAPRAGILSADTWTMAGTWARNAFLIQITGLAWLFTLLLIPLEAKQLFVDFALWSPSGVHVCAIVGVTLALLVIVMIPYQLYGTNVSTGQRSRSDRWVRWLVVVPAWCVSFCIGSLLWRDAARQSACLPCLYELDGYSSILVSAWRPWLWIIVLTWFGFVLVGCFSLRRHLRVHSIWISPLCTGVVYLCVAGIFYLDLILAKAERSENTWYAFILSGVLVLIAYGLGVVLFIGLTGRNSSEGFREWWTRLGTWVAVFAMAGAGLASAAAFSPQLVYYLTSQPTGSKLWTTVLGILGWLGTVISGLFAGKSSKTSGDDKNSSPGLQTLAAAGGLLFLLGGVVLASTLLYFLLWKIFAADGVDSSKVLETFDSLPLYAVPVAGVVTVIAGLLFSYFFEINIFGLNQFYRNRIVRCYLGATRMAPGKRKPNSFTGFDFTDDLKLHKLHRDEGVEGLDQANGRFRGPFPIFNCALNLAGSSDLAVKTRHSDSFFLTPLRCGSNRPLVGFAPTSMGKKKFAGGVMLGQAVAVSGAAVSPNMGYNTSPLVAFLLTMFNVRLGWWFPNPGQSSWNNRGLTLSLYYMTRELFGIADERRNYLNVSDGGHFENLGVYELIRRRCKVIIACDAECDEKFQFGGLGNLLRICETDFGAVIELDVKSIRQQKDAVSLAHCAVGQIKYSNGSIGYLIYLKASVTGDEPVGVCQYRSAHPSFPHESTGDQFFSEDQFESYRQLGLHVVEHSLRGTVPGQRPVSIAEKLDDVLTPAGCASETFLKHSAALTALWDKFRGSPELSSFFHELMGSGVPAAGKGAAAPAVYPDAEICMGLQLIQLMEDVFLDMRLDDFWDHPDNRGWALLFMRWARSQRFREIWSQTRRTFGIRFEHFCAARLGLVRDRPVVRV